MRLTLLGWFVLLSTAILRKEAQAAMNDAVLLHLCILGVYVAAEAIRCS